MLTDKRLRTKGSLSKYSRCSSKDRRKARSSKMVMKITSILTSIMLLLPLTMSLGISEPLKMSINDCLKRAEKNNKKVQKARENVEKFKQEYRSVRGQLLPQITFDAGYQYQKSEFPSSQEMPSLTDMINMPGDMTDLNDLTLLENDYMLAAAMDSAFQSMRPSEQRSASASVRLQQVIFRGSKLISGIDIASKIFRLQKRKLYLTKQKVAHQAIGKYYRTKLAKEVVEIKEEALSVAKRHFEQVSDMYENGVVSEYDTLRASLEVSKLEPEVLSAKKDYRLARKSFKDFLEIQDKDNEILLTEEMEPPELNIDSSQAVKEALNERVEKKLAELNVRIKEVNLRTKKLSFLPKIYFNAQYSYFGQNEEALDSDNFGNRYQLGLQMSIPLFTGLSNSAKTAKAKHSLNKSKIDLRDLNEKISLEVAKAYSDLKTNLEKVETQKRNVKLAKKGLEIAQSRYENQISNQLEILDAQLSLKSAKLAYLNAIYSAIMSHKSLQKAMGRKIH